MSTGGSSSSDIDGPLIKPEAVDEAWVRRVGRLSEEGPALEGVTQLALEAVDAPGLGGLDGLGSLLPSLEVGLAKSSRHHTIHKCL